MWSWRGRTARSILSAVCGRWCTAAVSRRSSGRSTTAGCSTPRRGLLAGNGMVQLSVADTAEGHRYARRLGVSTAAVLFAIDLIYAPPGRIPKTYPADAVMEAGWLVA